MSEAEKIWVEVSPTELADGDSVKADHENGSLVLGVFGAKGFIEGWGRIGAVPTYPLHTAGYRFFVERDAPGLPTTPGSVIRAETRWDGKVGYLVLDDDGNWGSSTIAVSRTESIIKFEIIYEAPEEV